MTGLVVHVTGEPASGKTTFAEALAARLRWLGRPVEVLDGDALRREIWPELGFTPADRRQAVMRAHVVARTLARNGVVAVVAQVSPQESVRQEVRELARAARLGFMLVYGYAPEGVRRERLSFRRGIVQYNFAEGYSYEAPPTSDFWFDSSDPSCIARVVDLVIDCTRAGGAR